MFKLFMLSQLGNDPLIELSYSKIVAYQFCPFKYKLLYQDGMRAPMTAQLALGQTIHKTLERFHAEKKVTWDDLLEAYDASWVNEGFSSPQQTVQYYEKGQKMLHDYLAFAQTRSSEIVLVEQEFKVPIGKRLLRGIVDRIDKLPDGSYEIIDYKTHAELWPQARIDTDLQLTLYAIGCRKGFNLEPARLSYLFLAHQVLCSTQRSQQQEDAALQELETVAQKIEAQDFKPNTQACSRCDFKSYCKYSPLKQSIKK